MSDDTERCPTCRAAIWYPTDQLGRVMAWCDQCRQSPPPQYAVATIGVRPPTAEQGAAMVLAFLQREPSHYYLAYQLRDTLGIADHTIRRSLALLVNHGDIAVVEREGFKRPYYTLNV